MDLFKFAAIVVSMDIILLGMIAVGASRWLNTWITEKEEIYLYGRKDKEGA